MGLRLALLRSGRGEAVPRSYGGAEGARALAHSNAQTLAHLGRPASGGLQTTTKKRRQPEQLLGKLEAALGYWGVLGAGRRCRQAARGSGWSWVSIARQVGKAAWSRSFGSGRGVALRPTVMLCWEADDE